MFLSRRQQKALADSSLLVSREYILVYHLTYHFNSICGAAFSKIAKHVNQVSSPQITVVKRREPFAYPFKDSLIPETPVSSNVNYYQVKP